MPLPRAKKKDADFVFLPLGGVGEIGMNAGLYGYGPEDDRQWILVDCGVTFANEMDEPGADLVFPDLRFLEEERGNLLGIIITHAHEDHYGALLKLWPRLRVPVHISPFAQGLLEAKAEQEPGSPKIPCERFTAGSRLTLGPFEIEGIAVAHSIPESLALAIRTPLGLAVHTGDWKIDETPVVGWRTDFARLEALGREGVRALVCDSTNAVREGISPSERDVAKTLAELIATAPHRVLVTTFASNVARIRAVAEAAEAAGRDVVVMGRAMKRAIDVSRECRLLDGLKPFLGEDAYGYLPRENVVALITGSQGEPRAALARIASGDHRQVALSKGDTVVFSSRTIPGNEKSVGQVVNGLATKGVTIVTDRDALVHVSGHPRREELRRMYAATKPAVAVPVHGEPLHLSVHARLAESLGVPDVVETRNGKIVRLAPGPAEVIDEVFTGRLLGDGKLVLEPEKSGVADRRRASFAGVVTVAVAINSKGELMADPEAALFGLPTEDEHGESFHDLVIETVEGVVEGMPKARRKDREALKDAIRRAVRSEVDRRWGKKPNCQVVVLDL